MAKRISGVREAGTKTEAAFRTIGERTAEARSSMNDLGTLIERLSEGVEGVAGEASLLAEASREIKARSGEIRDAAKASATSVGEIERIGVEIRHGVSDIEAGVRDSSDATLAVRELSHQNSDAMNKLTALVEGYATAEAAAEGSPAPALLEAQEA